MSLFVLILSNSPFSPVSQMFFSGNWVLLMHGPPTSCFFPASLQGFNWTLFIQTVLASVEVQLLPNEEVVVYGIPYLENLENIIDVFSTQ